MILISTIKIDPAKDYSINDLAVIRAQMRGIDVPTAAKEVRGRARARFADICKADPRILKVKARSNDGVRWPVVNGKAAAIILAPKNAS